MLVSLLWRIANLDVDRTDTISRCGPQAPVQEVDGDAGDV